MQAPFLSERVFAPFEYDLLYPGIPVLRARDLHDEFPGGLLVQSLGKAMEEL
jgi:hypothetical protein